MITVFPLFKPSVPLPLSSSIMMTYWNCFASVWGQDLQEIDLHARVLWGSALGNIHMGGVKEAGLGRRGPSELWCIDPMGCAEELECPFRTVPPWDKVTELFLTPFIDQLLSTESPGKWAQGRFLQVRAIPGEWFSWELLASNTPSSWENEYLSPEGGIGVVQHNIHYT